MTKYTEQELVLQLLSTRTFVAVAHLLQISACKMTNCDPEHKLCEAHNQFDLIPTNTVEGVVNRVNADSRGG